eukprot:Rhum_TRINITY_DN4234_c0_g2::Rhum_TRINITY_DN4234_c0_g2_i1::g.13336::m.13336/K19476/IST1; vacuolar protein sorting-associated protein IST1
MFGWGAKPAFDKHKFKAALKMSVSRMRMQQSKRTNAVALLRREIATLVGTKKHESARIKVEQVMRDEYYIEALEMVILFCDLLFSRQLLFSECKSCPPDLKEAISTIIWACPRTENIKELEEIRHMICVKLGREFVETAQENEERAVNQKVYQKLSVMVPEPVKCLAYLKGVCDEYDLDWEDVESALASTDLIPAPAPLGPPPAVGGAPEGSPDGIHAPPSFGDNDGDLEARLAALKRL